MDEVHWRRVRWKHAFVHLVWVSQRIDLLDEDPGENLVARAAGDVQGGAAVLVELVQVGRPRLVHAYTGSDSECWGGRNGGS